MSSQLGYYYGRWPEACPRSVSFETVVSPRKLTHRHDSPRAADLDLDLQESARRLDPSWLYHAPQSVHTPSRLCRLSVGARAILLPCRTRLTGPDRSYARNLFIPPSHYGIGHATPIRSLPDALDIVSGGRNKLVFVNNGFAGGDIAKVIDQVAGTARSTGKDIQILEQETELLSVCRSLRHTRALMANGTTRSAPTVRSKERSS